MYDPKFVQGARQLIELREARDRAKKALETAEEEYRDAESHLYEQMEKSGAVGAQKIDLGEPFGVVSFLNRTTYYGRIEDEHKAAEYYESRAMMDEVTSPKFVKKRISEEVRDCLEQGKALPPGIGYYTQRGVTITRQKK